MDTARAQTLAYKTHIKQEMTQETRIEYEKALGERKLKWMDPEEARNK